MTIPYITFMKHAEKVSKSASQGRPILKGVHHAENGDLIVTDSYRLYVAKNAHTRTDNAVINPKTGESIDGNYPTVDRLIPNEAPKMQIEINVIDCLKAAKALKACANVTDKIVMIKVVNDEVINLTIETVSMKANYNTGQNKVEEYHNLAFNGQYFIDALELFKEAGVQTVTINTHGSARPFTIAANDDLLVLILPIRVGC